MLLEPQDLPLSAPQPVQVYPFQLYTDASEHGGGVVAFPETASGKADHDNSHVKAWTWSPSQALEHINVLELNAVERALEWLPNFQQTTLVHIHTDSQVVYYVLKSLYTKSSALHGGLMKVLSLLVQKNIQLDISWVPTDLNPADAPSRAAHNFQSHPTLPEWDQSFLSRD